MYLSVLHRTRHLYRMPVADSINEVRLRPATDDPNQDDMRWPFLGGSRDVTIDPAFRHLAVEVRDKRKDVLETASAIMTYISLSVEGDSPATGRC